ncbi:TPA: hypothetical protein ACQ5AO_004255, partial [Klebsiella pneumoniae]
DTSIAGERGNRGWNNSTQIKCFHVNSLQISTDKDDKLSFLKSIAGTIASELKCLPFTSQDQGDSANKCNWNHKNGRVKHLSSYIT